MFHTVAPGESLFTIALQYQVPLLDLKEINHLYTMQVEVGQQLLIPDTIALRTKTRSTERSATYTVKAGDTLWSIATNFKVGIDELKKLNKLTTNALQVGQSLLIPSASGGSGTTNNTTANLIAHTVAAGESLWSIAKKYGATIDEVKQLNNLSSNSLSVGQQLKIPNKNNINTGGGGNATEQWYTVKAGDTLNLLSFIFDVTVQDLRRWNNLTSDTLRIGQQLLVKKGNTGTNANTGNVSNNTNTNPSGKPVYYTVKAGDGLFNIAARFNTTVADLYRWNNLTNNNLSIGQQLIVGYSASGGSSDVTPPNNNPTPPTPDVPVAVQEPENEPLDFKYAVNITNTVGNNARNLAADVRRIQEQLNRLGFLAAADFNSERPFAEDSQAVSSQHLPQTIAAIKLYQRRVTGGTEDGVIRPNHPTLMFLNTAVAIPDAAQLAAIMQARTEFELTILEGSAILGTQLTSAVGATAFGNQPAEVLKVQQRLEDLGYLNPSHKETPLANTQGAIPQANLTATIQAIRKFQEQRVNFWRDKMNLVNASEFTAGVVGKDEKDFTFRILRDFTEYYINFPAYNGQGKEQLLFNNFVRSGFTINVNGISYPGEVSPKSLTLQTYINTGLNAIQAKALKYVSEHEGDFDALNTYDKANFSYGFIQFAGNGGGLAPMMGFLKYKYPETFQNRFQKYGIDVEYSIYNGNIDDAHLVVVAASGQLLRDIAAEQHLRDNKQLCAVFVKAAYAPNVQRAQIESAKRKFVVPALTIKLNLSLPVVRVLASDKITVSEIYVGEQAEAYRKKSTYTTLKQQGRIQETSLSLSNNPVLEFIRSEKGITALIDITVNQWINKTNSFFTQAIAKIAAATDLDTVAKLRKIDEFKVIDYIRQIGDGRIQERMQNILDANELSSSK
ncbi:LysM peptidoglycan-binding domain-containing protein [Sphingobacteriales bacterium UPWRP_1]|nr:hypothetical protein BVG80_00195 [Sphingobacteriales bacterium TSM_CSM]PSJ71804.1 LysM peptidoglycan-binding domain-containing protein [Sphingobacteriales bacterium UPWRP_1]